MLNNDKWRDIINNLPGAELTGDGPPIIETFDDDKIESTGPKAYSEDSVLVYKMTTEVYVYQHIGSDSWFGANTLQEVSMLGEMTLDQARALVKARKLRRKKE